ncbi:alpha-L-rhamnosidase C-terminal domain-containing protein [Cohnella silvisoli]|uniref:Alpha-rhamnosidase n=1 Tax=Cohnella silvisoli TaxID=2873699 RepID=A0ABV1KXK8_9BACL|nr:alpha-L-rhamnosidase C-terminal domain-containing protein [Cohnella silvisoli]MCD9024193.1 alpha-rhamnosidase [Cohnella silvisoli]
MDSNERQGTWLWYPEDYEIWLHAKVSVLRQFRGYICPPPWRLDSAYDNVKFRKTFDLAAPGKLTLSVQGMFVLHFDSSMIPTPYERTPVTTVEIPAGKHELMVTVYNDKAVPAIYPSGCGNENGWEVTSHNGTWVKAASWQFNEIDEPPGDFPFSYETVEPDSVKEQGEGTLVDFGRETFGYVILLGVIGKGTIRLYYGESSEEALAGELAETFDELVVDSAVPTDYVTPVTRAFRYIQLKLDPGITYAGIRHEYEYLPMERRGAFRSSDERLNRIWDLSAHTLHMNMREFLFDGMKRDRWVWGGDAHLGTQINNYVFFEQDVTKRTLVALRGKDPVERHINTIMDFTFHWFLSFREYYLNTGDLAFIERSYPKMLTLMEFCLGRRNEAGMMEGFPNDWVFIDWAPMDLRGEVSTEQIFLCRSLETMELFAEKLGDDGNKERFGKLARELKDLIFKLFWDEGQGGFIHSRWQSELNRQILKYPNIFATRFGYLDEKQLDSVKQNVMLNDSVQKIKTPFMRFFELDALCRLGERSHVLDEIRSYWGGMIDLGATAFWEEYEPSVPPQEQYDMYGDKFRKSLCHAWGAAPILLLGKYVLGVEPLAPGYAEYRVEPDLCGLDWIEGKVPTPDGEIEVYMDRNRVSVKTCGFGVGVLRIASRSMPSANDGKFVQIGEGLYELRLTRPGHLYEVELAAATVEVK